MVVCEIPTIAMNSRSAGVWAHQPNLAYCNYKRSFAMKWRPTKVQERFRSKWMVKRTSIQKIQVQYWILFSIPSTVNLNISVLMSQLDCWMHIQVTIQWMTVFKARNIPFQAGQEWRFRRNRFGPFGSLWGGEFGILICQERGWQMKWLLARLSPQWQWQWYGNCWFKKLEEGYRYRFSWGILLQSGLISYRMTFVGLLVSNGSGIHYGDRIQCPTAF